MAGGETAIALHPALSGFLRGAAHHQRQIR